jgi:anti-sigma factor ChrR (cupin superfamily)
MSGWPEDIEPSLVAALAEELAPVTLADARRAAMRARVLAAATDVPLSSPAATTVVRADEGHWLPLLPGVTIKPLHVDRAGRTQTSLWKLIAGARVPSHEHDADEECLVVSGSLLWDGVTYNAGDYLLAPQGLHHSAFGSPGGATLLIRSALTAPLEQVFAAAGY